MVTKVTSPKPVSDLVVVAKAIRLEDSHWEILRHLDRVVAFP
jgi:hypothetical protein